MHKFIFRNIFILFILCITNSVSSQSNLDQLRNTYADVIARKLTYDINRLGMKNTDSAKKLLDEFFPIVKNVGHDSVLSYYMYSQAINAYRSGEIEESLMLAENALKNMPKNKQVILQIMLINQMGSAQIRLGQYDRAILSFEEALEKAQARNNLRMQGAIFGNIANVFRALKQKSKVEEYNLKSIQAFKSINDTNRIAQAYYNLAGTAFEGKEYKKCGLFMDTLKTYLKGVTNDNLLGFLYGGVSKIFTREKNYKEALVYAKKGLSINKKLNNKIGLIKDYENHGDIYKGMDIPEKAENYYLKGFNLAKEIKDKKNIAYLADNLASFYYEQKKYKQTIDYAGIRKQINDSITNEKIIAQVTDLEAKYETGKKEKELLQKDLELEKKGKKIRIITAISLFLVVLSLLGYFAYRNVNQKRKIKEDEFERFQQDQENKLLESVLEGEERERNRLGKELHDGVNGMLAVLRLKLEHLAPKTERIEELDDALKMLNNTSNEVRNISHNLLPKNIIEFGLVESVKDLCNQITSSGQLTLNYTFIHMEERLKKSVALSIYRVIQELLSNILKHAEANEAFLQISRNDDVLQISIEDNGKGFEGSVLENKGVGLGNIKNRLKSINGKFDIESDRKMGTTVLIDIILNK